MAPKTRKRSKAASRRKGGRKVVKVKKRTPFFAYANSDKMIDLKKDTLKIKMLVDFKEIGKNKTDFALELWEIKEKGSSDRGKSYKLLKINLSAQTAGVAWVVKVSSIEQDENRFPKKKSQKGDNLWLSAKLLIQDKNGKPIAGGESIEFVLPPLEYDGVLELQLGANVGKPVCGLAHVTWSTLAKMMLPYSLINKKAGITSDGLQKGALATIVLHCMNAINVVDRPSESFEIDKNIKILKNYKFSAHIIIGREGELYHLVDMNRLARHAKGVNTRSIGVELLGFGDDFRQQVDNKYKGYKSLIEKKKKIQKALDKHKAAKSDGKSIVIAGGKKIKVDIAIKRCENAVVKLDAKIGKRKDWAEDYEQFTKAKNAAGTPDVFRYTDKQIKALRQLLIQLARRYGYKKVRSHHSIDPDRKKDPGEYFDWAAITPFLPEGSLKGNEGGSGGIYTVK